MRTTPGSLTWLVAHDVRLSWRGFTELLSGRSPLLSAVVIAAAGFVVHLLAWPLVPLVSPLLMGPGANLPLVATLITCTFTWMLAQSLFGAARTLYARGDLDLLLGSPLPASRIVAAKALGIAMGSFGSMSLLALPLANAGAVSEGTAWLALYPALAALALLATAAGLVLTVTIFNLVGAGRARLWTQMTGAVIAGAFVLGAQIVAVLPSARRLAITTWLESQISGQTPGPFAFMRLPVEAVRGSVADAALLALIAVAAMALATRLLGHAFAGMSLAATGAGEGSRRTGASRRPRSFRAGLAPNMRRKEWRLLSRDPGTFAQLGLQIIYTIPVAIILLRNEMLPPVFALAPTIVVIAAQVAASIAWLTVSGEDAPELIATAPVETAAVERAKLNAVALPVLIVLALPVTALALVSLEGALLTLAAAAAAATSTALLNFWHPMPGNRRGMLRRHSQSKLIALVEHAMSLMWATAIVLALIDPKLAGLPVAVVVAILAAMRARARLAHG
jgi:ABC-2 type transport system permease protein